MKNNCTLIIVLALISIPFAASAQVSPSVPTSTKAPGNVQDGDAAVLAEVLAVPSSQPLGPPDLLKEYEQAMAGIAQGFSAQVSEIAEAVQQNKISEDQGEYLTTEAYQLAMMQFQAFSGLHDMLEEELSHAAPAAPQSNPAPATGLNGSDYDGTAHKVEFITNDI